MITTIPVPLRASQYSDSNFTLTNKINAYAQLFDYKLRAK